MTKLQLVLIWLYGVLGVAYVGLGIMWFAVWKRYTKEVILEAVVNHQTIFFGCVGAFLGLCIFSISLYKMGGK
jgi:hypothetical protein